MKQKESAGGGDSATSIEMATPAGKGADAVTDADTTAGGKGKKLGIKRIKKKPDMNISKGKLKSVTTPKNFSFMNMSVQKQTLRANNRALAQNLAKARQEIRHLNTEMQTLRSQNQEQYVELNRLKRVVGLKDEQIQMEVQQRIQDEMQGMRSLLEELTQSMMQSSTFITKMNDKCLVYCSRRSTDSCRSASLGNSQGNQSLNRSNTRPAFREMVHKDDLMAKYLSKADEYTAPPGGRVFSNNNAADMSIIAEQSMIDNDEEMYMAKPLVSVDDTIIEISPVETAPAKPLSKLPQRVLKYTDSTTLNTNTTSSSEASSTCSDLESISHVPKTEKAGKGSTAKESAVKEKEKSRSKNSRSKVEKSGKEKDIGKEGDVSSKDSKSKESNDDTNKVIQINKNRADEGNVIESKDNSIDADVSAFGFGGSFAADLVSGSPITAEKRRETFIMSKQTDSLSAKTKEKEKRRETYVKSKEPDNSEIRVSEKDETAKSKRETFVLPKAPLEADVKGNKNRVKTGNVKNDNKGKNKLTKEKSDDKLKSTMKRRDTYATENPFIPKKTNISRSPVKPLDKKKMRTDAVENPAVEPLNEEVYNTIENPFKPTKTLLRSPVHVTVQNASPEKKIDSLAFLAKFRESLDSKPVESSPLPDPVFPDEPTTYFNSEMEFTSVIDSTRLLKTLSRSEKNSPVVPQVTETKPDDAVHLLGDEHSNSESQPKSSGKLDSQMQPESNDTAAVEVRTKKPGVFTFSIGRKEADGTRKAVPEKVSKARSKKKKPVTPEKEERRTGSDRDMFNFGDRTPTMPLDKLAKARNVYDLSMNESVAAAPVSLNNFKEKEQKNVTETKPDDQNIYYMPLKGGSPDDKPVSKRARSQSRSRSKSRKKDDDDDEDWVPGGTSHTRSKSQVRNTKDEETSRRRGRSQSRRRVVNDSETDENEVEMSRERSKSKSRNTEKEETAERQGRSRSRQRVSKGESSKDDTEEDKEELTSRRCRSRSRRRISEGENIKDNAEEEKLTSRRSRSRSRRRVSEDKNSKDNSEEGKEEFPSRRGRSRSRGIVLKDENRKDDTVVDKEELPSRRCRSRSRRRALNDEDGNTDKVEDKVEGKLKAESKHITGDDNDTSGNRSGRSKTRGLESDNKKDRMGRSRSRVRPKTDDAESNSDVVRSKTMSKNSELHLDEINLAPRRSARSKSQIRKPLVEDSDDDNDIDDSPQLQRKSRSRKKTFEIKVFDTDTEVEKERDEVLDKQYPHQESVLVVQDSDESETQEDTKDNEKSRKASNYKNSNMVSELEIIDIAEGESDSEKVQKLEKTQQKSRRRAKSTKYDDSDFEEIVENDKIKSKSKNSENSKGERNNIDDDIGRNFEFINKRRGKSLRIPDDNSDDIEIKKSDTVDTKKESVTSNRDDIDIDGKYPESPKPNRREAKSTKKSTKKRKVEDSTSGKSGLNIAEKLDKDEAIKSSVTPAMVPETSKKSAKTSRTAKSTKKAKVERHPDQTPVNKEEKINSQISDKTSTLALLKKRLTMVGMKHTVEEDVKSGDHPSRKRSQPEVDEPQNDGCDTPGKRSRRNKNPVSYVPKPLNVKLRRGDEMFQDSMSKVKAEQSRLLIAKKTSVPKISREDKENIMQT
ncbi:uncharacterized protein LOC123531521 isoform X2 [Mercenaria mercenaria]|uniref:uncharacterized protein LOC123531521 isoform X2 n=1 Tax=Mercenaria mercenaria TaxID=6596 RepID=UPI00234E91A0|nr:uncharacterized protein LOC123531521 isoform X2 [Mercenaria mercenaria]